MDPLRAAPGAELVLAAVAGEPGVHVVDATQHVERLVDAAWAWLQRPFNNA